MLNTEGEELRFVGLATSRLQAHGIQVFYGYRARAHRGIVYVAREDWDALVTDVIADRSNNPVGYGFYLGGNGNTVLVPAWTLEPKAIATARALARRPRWVRRLYRKHPHD